MRTASTGDGSLINEVTNLLKCMRISPDGDPTVKAMVKQVVYSERDESPSAHRRGSNTLSEKGIN